MSSHPVDHLHPVVESAQRLAARLDSLAQLRLLAEAEAESSEATTESGAATAALPPPRVRSGHHGHRG